MGTCSSAPKQYQAPSGNKPVGYQKKPDFVREAIVGPVIGQVSETTARVLYEFSHSGDVTVTVTNTRTGRSHSEKKRVPAKLPVVFAFSGLEPGSRYTVQQQSEFKCFCGGAFNTPTGDLDAAPMTFAVVSCNKAAIIRGLRAEQIDLWDDLAQRAENGDIDYIIHVGDQIYADEVDAGIEGGDPRSCFSECLKSLHKPGARWMENKGPILEKSKAEGRQDSTFVLQGEVRPAEEWEGYRHQILESYRDCYRDTWSHRPCRRALANASNLMMCDDHDISDDWGDRPYHRPRVPMSPECFIGNLGLQVYHEYQRSLREDVAVDQPIKVFDNEGYVIRIGDLGIIMVDMRGPRSFRCPQDQLDGDPPLICPEQWAMIEGALREWTDVRQVMFCTPVPPVLFSKSITQLGAMVVNDTAGQFTYSQSHLLIKLLNLLHDWKKADPRRDLCIYTGDIHVGQHTEIKYDGEPAIHQLIASSVGNQGAGKAGCLVMKIMGELQNSIDDHWTFKHHSRVPAEAERNYGIARFRTWKGEDAPQVKNYHVQSVTDKALQPNEIAKKLQSCLDYVNTPGLVSCFGSGVGARRYTFIGGAGMAIGDLVMKIPGEKERRGGDFRGYEKMPDIPEGYMVSLRDAPGLTKFELRCAEAVGNYIVRADDAQTKGKFPAGEKQAEFWAEDLNPDSTSPGEDIVFVRWRHDDGFASTILSSDNYTDKAWTLLYAFRFPQKK
eukprot:Hpha_TRINITY_DN16753_c2_g8::TRINITY_DN16753_c2_g8_i1::g.77714::m.77714